MQFGVHLPQIAFTDEAEWTLARVSSYVRTAREQGFAAVTANDHLLFARGWLDGLAALNAVMHETGDMDLMTTVSLPVVRGPIQTAKALAATDLMSGGRLTVGVGPGSSARDYEAVGLSFDERWKRLDDAVPTLRALWRGETYRGRFYSTEDISLQPQPLRGGPPIWIGSWGSDAGLRRTARLADGWLASAYNTTPALFADALSRLTEYLDRSGKDASSFPNALATTFMYLTESDAEARRVLSDFIGRAISRPLIELRDRLLVGSAEACAAKVRAYAEAGVQRMLLWPVADENRQLELFAERVVPLTT